MQDSSHLPTPSAHAAPDNLSRPPGQFVIGTRESPLAMAQAHEVRGLLLKHHPSLTPDDITLLPMTTRGDQILDRTLALAGGKGLFTKELEIALANGLVDLVVHSSKDMPTALPPGLELSAFLKREDARDVIISRDGRKFNDLDPGAVIGTASLRRQALALRARPDLKVIPFRGNVQTRLKKLKEGQADATFLALAGLNRLNMANVVSEILPLDRFPAAPAQGAIAIETRIGDDRVLAVTNSLNHPSTHLQVTAERAFLERLDGSCRTPIAAVSTIKKDRIYLRGMILSLDGSEIYQASSDLPCTQATDLGYRVGDDILKAAGSAFFERLNQEINQS